MEERYLYLSDIGQRWEEEEEKINVYQCRWISDIQRGQKKINLRREGKKGGHF